MCEWFWNCLRCCCCGSEDTKISTLKNKKKNQKNLEHKTNQKQETPDLDAKDSEGKKIESFYDNRDDTNDNKTESKTSEISESVLIPTYNLPFENCRSVEELLRHLGYDILKQVGKGGFGLVHKCIYTDKKTKKKKVLASKKVSLNRKDKVIKALKSEIFVLKKCKHPYIIGLEDYFIINCGDASWAFLLMEFAECGTLQDEINKAKPLSNEMAKHYFSQTATALAYLHRLKIAHKDLKPENILLVKNKKTGRKDVRVGDFGLSQNVYNRKEGVIKPGQFGGTRAYMAPEILRLDVYRDHRKIEPLSFDPFKSDLWALGVCLFEMLTKTIPFDSNNTQDMLSLQEKAEFTYPRSVRDSIDPKADELIRQLLEPDVNKRIDPLGVLTHPWIKDKVDLSLINVNQKSNQ